LEKENIQEEKTSEIIRKYLDYYGNDTTEDKADKILELYYDSQGNYLKARVLALCSRVHSMLPYQFIYPL